MSEIVLLCILLFAPLVGFLITRLLEHKLSKGLGATIASLAVVTSFGAALWFLGVVLNRPDGITITLAPWFSAGDFSISFSFLIDRLSAFMMLIITGVGALIHLYSSSYMHDDEGHNRYFSYLNLFMFFMLILVSGASLPITFIGWEGVGLCSYLLIGFWNTNVEYNAAARKAFVMNRIGDLGLLLGIFLTYNVFGTLTYTDIIAAVGEGGFGIDSRPLVLITLLFFIGAAGKSAQLPLYTWLPDAMAGPTPVSALIHAATMVTAGIYLIVRTHVLYDLAPIPLQVIAWIGGATALLAALIATGQNDIKKVLAYSTVSQLGLMFMALGVGAYGTAMFHLGTHAFFKALLFLGAGSVIHAVHAQDMRGMGGLRKFLPITFITMLIGTLAISGIPPFAGFFSKDEILVEAFKDNKALYLVGQIVSALTAFYMFRLLALTFLGKPRPHFVEAHSTGHKSQHDMAIDSEVAVDSIGGATEDNHAQAQHHGPHESPWPITVPLIVLAIFSTVAGFFGLPEVFGSHHALADYLSPILLGSGGESHLAQAEGHLSHATEWLLIGIATLVAVAMSALALLRFSKGPATKQTPLGRVLENKFYVDEVYAAIITKPLFALSRLIERVLEHSLIDGIVNGVAHVTRLAGQVVRSTQSGHLNFYLFATVLAVVVLLAFKGFSLFVI